MTVPSTLDTVQDTIQPSDSWLRSASFGPDVCEVSRTFPEKVEVFPSDVVHHISITKRSDFIIHY